MGGGVPPRPETWCRTVASGARNTEAAAGMGHRVGSPNPVCALLPTAGLGVG